MSDSELRTWERRWADRSYVGRPTPSPFLAVWVDRIPGRGRALDVAAGSGRNARLLSGAGFDVTAVEGSPSAVEQGRAMDADGGVEIAWEIADLDHWDPGEACWDVISVVRYRNPALWPRLRRALVPGGWILVEHHLLTTIPDAAGPTDPAFRLQPGELLEAFGDLRVVHLDEQITPADRPGEGGRFVTQSFVAVNGDPGW